MAICVPTLLTSSLSPILNFTIVISGFNTDVEYGGVTYHVQTEDKGLARPVIVSLIYNGGTILASKRQPYDDLLKEKFDENLLAARLQRQHKLICAAIQAGRIDDLKQLSEKDDISNKRPAEKSALSGLGRVSSQSVAEVAVTASQANPIPRPTIDPLPGPFEPEEIVIDPISVIEEVFLPADAVSVVSELSGRERPINNKLTLELLGDGRFRSGDRQTVSILVCRGSSSLIVPGAQVMVKVLGSAFRPMIFHTLTDANGMANVSLHFPEFMSGRAALLVRVACGGEEVELRRTVETGRGGRN